jgi:hypothetical protein
MAHDDEAAPAADDPRETSRIRTIFTVVLGVIAVVGLFASTIAVWAQGVLFNSDKVAKAAERALEQPEAAASMSEYVTDQVFTLVDVSTLVENVLPEQLDGLSGMIANGAHEYVASELRQLLETPKVRTILVKAIRSAHARLMRVLEGDGVLEGVSISPDAVTVNLLPIISLGLQQLKEVGVGLASAVPDLPLDGNPVEQIGLLETTFGHSLPSNFGQLTVFKGSAAAQASEIVQQAQSMVVLAKRAIKQIIIITIAAFIGTLLVANRRRRAVLVLGLASAAVMLIARTAINQLLARTPNLVLDPGARSALQSALTELASSLLRVVTLLLLIGLAAAALVMLTSAGAAGGGALARLLVRNRQVSAAVAFAVAVGVIVMFGLDVAPLIVAGVIAAVGVVLMSGRHTPTTT